MRWLILVLLLVGCVEVVCNEPYITVGTSCCLDRDNNSICDSDDIETVELSKVTAKAVAPIFKEEPEKTILVEEDNLEDVAKQLATYEEEEDFKGIYSLLASDLKNVISEKKFITLYPAVIYGYYVSYDDEGDILGQGQKQKDFKSKRVYDVIENETTAAISYTITDKSGNQIEGEYISFVKEDEWKVNDYKILVYASCEDVSDCSGEVLENWCTDICDDYRTYELNNETPYACVEHVCNCLCYHEAQDMSYRVKPTS